MRSILVAAAFAAGALAVPFNEKRSYAPPAPKGYGDKAPDAKAPDAKAPEVKAPEVKAPEAEAPKVYGNKVEVAYDVVYVTQIVTVTADGEAPSYTPPPAKHHGHKHKKPKTTTTTTEAAPVYTPEAPPPKYEAPAPSEAPAAPAAPSAPEGGSYADVCLHHHNEHRKNHTVSLVTWSDSLAATAQKIADTCIYEHNVDMDGGGYGQNIAAGIEKDKIGVVISDMFYNSEMPLFSDEYGKPEPNMDKFELWGHFTQIVWKGTTEIGCATASCASLANTGGGVSPHFTVCNYKGPGNYAGMYNDNVSPPGTMATIYGDGGAAPQSYKK